MKNNLVASITVNYGTDYLTIKCINSLINSESNLLNTVCIFDNKVAITSQLEFYLDDTYKYAYKKFISSYLVKIYIISDSLNIIYLSSDVNLGFSNACNISYFILCQLSNYKYYYLINSDCLVYSNSIKELVKAADSHPVVVYSSKVLDLSGKVWFEGGVYNKLLGTTKHVRYKQFKKEKSKFLSGCALLLPEIILNEIGFLDPIYFLYGEDLDFSIRLQRNGYKLDICNLSIVTHAPGSSSVKRSYCAYDLYVTNTLGCFFKNFPFIYFPTIFFYHFVKFTSLNILIPRNFKNNIGYLRGIINASRKFIKKNA